MSEYIKVSDVLAEIEKSDPDIMADYGEYYGTEWGFSREKLSEIIKAVPTAKVAEARHGHWELPIFTDSDDGLDPRVKCSECGGIEAAFARWKYCPNCGALMKEDEYEAG